MQNSIKADKILGILTHAIRDYVYHLQQPGMTLMLVQSHIKTRCN